MQDLISYYAGPWREDKSLSDKGEFPSDLKCGILMEDTFWDFNGQRRDLAIRMMELGLKITKE